MICRGPVSNAESRLYIFPHAGGSADFYMPFAKAFTRDVKCVAVQYRASAREKTCPSTPR